MPPLAGAHAFLQTPTKRMACTAHLDSIPAPATRSPRSSAAMRRALASTSRSDCCIGTAAGAGARKLCPSQLGSKLAGPFLGTMRLMLPRASPVLLEGGGGGPGAPTCVSGGEESRDRLSSALFCLPARRERTRTMCRQGEGTTPNGRQGLGHRAGNGRYGGTQSLPGHAHSGRSPPFLPTSSWRHIMVSLVRSV
jgi:hypothetical protein